MSIYDDDRQRRQAEREAYREAARRLHGSDRISIGEHAHVQTCEGGAYVEATIWIPEQGTTPADNNVFKCCGQPYLRPLIIVALPAGDIVDSYFECIVCGVKYALGGLRRVV